MAIMVEAISNMISSRLSLCNQGASIVECGEATKELSEGVNLKLHREEEELKQEIQPEEEVEASEQKEVVVGCLGYVENIKESEVEELSSMKFGRDIKEESDVEEVDRESKEIDQEVDSISDFLSTWINPLDNLVEPSSSELESNVKEDDKHLMGEGILFPSAGREILITEATIREALLCRPRTEDTCTYEQAEVAIHCMTFDYEALKRVIATPDAPWVLDSGNKKPKGMRFTYLSREAKTWQHIFAHCVLPVTHFSEILMDMLVLIGCIMVGKEVDFPRLIRKSIWRVHIRGLLAFPTLVTSMIELADVTWEDDDVTPPPPNEDDKEPPPKRRSRARAVEEAAQPSSSAAAAGPPSTLAAAASLPPPPAPEPTYLLVQHLFCLMERLERRIMRCLDRIDQEFVSQDIELPRLLDSPASDEQDQKEEHDEEPTH
ncbi:hypothetical protein Ahy_A07g035070 [Arachis hypogaea]|uniref:Putative plant transposon protein domain-containing protein n=1 Tax=Arachis hypogaea TaxID=3818 RepID=A0A445CDC3_ARAHY|nr:hypothetical protein Ahy_A07g035070 [Arachis hypogaea]